jgi:hypothetical protein
MAVRDDFTAGEVLAAADLNDTFGAKLDLAGGKVLQVVRATDTTERSTTSTSFVDVTGMSVTITPQKSDSAILILALGQFSVQFSGGTPYLARYQITDSSNNALSGAEDHQFGPTVTAGTEIASLRSPFILFAYSTPGAITAQTYKMRFAKTGGATAVVQNNLSTGQMYAIEVSA